MKKDLSVFLIMEGIYLFLARYLLDNDPLGIFGSELIKTGFRILSILAIYKVFKGLFIGKYKIGAFSFWLLPCMAFLMLVPFFSAPPLPTSAIHLFAATSLAVGIREELSYRGVLQSILKERLGFWPALFLSNVAFVVYHYGAQPLTAWNVFFLFAFGCVMGIFFHLTRSLILVAILHALYDMIFCYAPLFKCVNDCLLATVCVLIALLGSISVKLSSDSRVAGE